MNFIILINGNESILPRVLVLPRPPLRHTHVCPKYTFHTYSMWGISSSCCWLLPTLSKNKMPKHSVVPTNRCISPAPVVNARITVYSIYLAGGLCTRETSVRGGPPLSPPLIIPLTRPRATSPGPRRSSPDAQAFPDLFPRFSYPLFRTIYRYFFNVYF